MTMVVWRGCCGTGGKPAGNSEYKHDPNQPEEPIYSTSKKGTEGFNFNQSEQWSRKNPSVPFSAFSEERLERCLSR